MRSEQDRHFRSELLVRQTWGHRGCTSETATLPWMHYVLLFTIGKLGTFWDCFFWGFDLSPIWLSLPRASSESEKERLWNGEFHVYLEVWPRLDPTLSYATLIISSTIMSLQEPGSIMSESAFQGCAHMSSTGMYWANVRDALLSGLEVLAASLSIASHSSTVKTLFIGFNTWSVLKQWR